MIATAQTPVAEPTSQQIIDALKPVRTRGLRNLGVKQAEPEAPANALPGNNASGNSVSSSSVSGTASPASAAAPVAEQSATGGGSIDLAIQFDFNSSKVSPSSRRTLEQLSIALASSELASLKFRIEGHTDSRGSVAYNQRLSEARADEVRRVLVGRRIAAGRLYAIGKGASQPLNAANPAAPENRRVRIVSLEQ